MGRARSARRSAVRQPLAPASAAAVPSSPARWSTCQSIDQLAERPVQGGVDPRDRLRAAEDEQQAIPFGHPKSARASLAVDAGKRADGRAGHERAAGKGGQRGWERDGDAGSQAATAAVARPGTTLPSHTSDGMPRARAARTSGKRQVAAGGEDRGRASGGRAGVRLRDGGAQPERVEERGGRRAARRAANGPAARGTADRRAPATMRRSRPRAPPT